MYGRAKTNGAYGAVFGTFLKQKLANKPFTVVGDGKQKRDFVYVTDLVEAFYLAAKTNLNGEVFNVGSGNPQTINYLIKLLGNGKKVYLPERPGEPNITFANINKIKNLLNWSPKVKFEEGVKNMLKNINYWESAPLWDKKGIENATKGWYKYMKKKVNIMLNNYEYKILDLKSLKSKVGPFPRNKKVIMCHGVFDIVHPGRIRHLSYAKSKADILIASITTDKHVKKGDIDHMYLKILEH